MKKTFRILLSALLCIALLSSLLSIAMAVTPTAPGGVGLSWVGYNMGMQSFGDTTQINGGINIATVTDKIYSGDGADSDATAIKISNAYAQLIGAQIAVEANSYYQLSFYYMTEELGSWNALKAAFSNVGVIAQGSYWNTNNWLGALDRDKNFYTNQHGAMVTLGGSIAGDLTTNTWNKVTISFYTADLTNAYIALRPVIGNQNSNAIYLDAFELVKVDPFVGANDGAPAWTVYTDATSTFGKSGTTHTSATVTESTEQVYSGDGADADGTAWKISSSAYCQYAAYTLELKKNTYYELTGYYYAAAVPAGIFSDIRVVKNGGVKSTNTTDNLAYIERYSDAYYYNQYGNKVFLSGVRCLNATANQWNKFTVSFYSGDVVDAKLVVRPVAGSTYPVYVDALALTEVDTLVNAEQGAPGTWTIYNPDTSVNKVLGNGGIQSSSDRTATETTDKCYDGDDDQKSWKLSESCFAQYAAYSMEFKANTYYELSAYYYSESVPANGSVFSHIKIAKNGISIGDETSNANLGTLPRDSDAFYYDANGVKVALTGIRHTGAVANQWNKLTVTFYSGNLTDALLVLRPVQGNSFATYIDAIQLTEIVPASDSVMSDARNSMRSEGTQALRYKFDVDKAALSASYGSYSITEYGYIAVRDKYLDQGELTFTNGTLNNAYADFGVAYNKADGTDVKFDETDTKKIVSVALINIGLDKETGVVDYEAYGSGYTVVPYFVLTGANGEAIYAYGDSYSVSVFETVKYIVNEENTDVDPADRLAVNNNVLDVAANDADTTTDKTVRDYYNAWVSANN